MKLQIVSDLHLEFSPLEIKNSGADVLILSGDICVVDYFDRGIASPYYKRAVGFAEFFHQVSMEFDKIFYVMGNHEFYHGYWEDTADRMKELLAGYRNISVLDKEFEDYNDYRFFGGALWTDMDRGNPVAASAVQGGLNDYKLITLKAFYGKLRPSNTMNDHRRYLKVISDNLVDNSIVIGHHAPSFASVPEEYRHNRYAYLNPGYYSDLSEFILDRPEIKLWTHGHMHSNSDYMIGDTRVVANPRGYKDENPYFSPDTLYEV